MSITATLALHEGHCLLDFATSMSRTRLSDQCSSGGLPSAIQSSLSFLPPRYLVTTLQPVPRGTEGAVSLEGTLAGLVAALLVCAVAYATGQVGGRVAGWLGG